MACPFSTLIGDSIHPGSAPFSRGDEVVAYALSRSISPALIAEYQTQLPDKKLLQVKLHEFYALNAMALDHKDPAVRGPRKARNKKR